MYFLQDNKLYNKFKYQKTTKIEVKIMIIGIILILLYKFNTKNKNIISIYIAKI